MAADAKAPQPDANRSRLEDLAEAWIRGDVDEHDQAELRALVAAARTDHAAAAELHDRFSGPLEFGTAGLRGAMAAGPRRMNRAVVIRAAAGLGAFLHGALPATTPRVVVGYDARRNSLAFALDTVAVLTAAGVEALLLPSALPTPVLAYAARHCDADGAVMVTASHNPAGDNGYKVYLGGRVVPGDGRGSQIVPPHDAEIAAAIAAIGPAGSVPYARSGWRTLGPEVYDSYLVAIGALASDGPRDLRIVTTAMHGVGGQPLAELLSRTGFADVVPVAEQAKPDPNFPTVPFPNPEEPGALDLALATARTAGADLVLAVDPDADRCAVCVPGPDGWRTLRGDEVGALLGDDVARRLSARDNSRGTSSPADAPRLTEARAPASHPPAATLACSIVSSRLLSRIAAAAGLGFATTLTGFKWISRVHGLVFGYEEAIGYCVAPQLVHDKDGLSAALAVAELAAQLKAEGATLADRLDDLARRHGLYATDQIAERFASPESIGAALDRLRAEPPNRLAGAAVAQVADLADGLDGLPPTEGILLRAADDTRIVVRPSGTEPKLKCYLEVVVPLARDATADEVATARAAAADRLARAGSDIRAALGLA